MFEESCSSGFANWAAPIILATFAKSPLAPSARFAFAISRSPSGNLTTTIAGAVEASIPAVISLKGDVFSIM
jgi:hypothetical protein